jgi:hypothetical protein
LLRKGEVLANARRESYDQHMKQSWLVFLLIVAVWVLLYLIMERRKQRRRLSGRIAAAASSGRKPGAAGFSNLVTACMGDSARATQLVQFEQRKNPKLSYGQAISAAMERLSADRSS